MSLSSEFKMIGGDKATDDESEVQQFYNGASVFVTGATGFMGKVLVEKLLWSCPNVKTIYYLLRRSKRGKSFEERAEELESSPCFDRLRKRSPGFKAKLVVIPGELREEGLAVSDQDRHLLAEHVTVVFHVAATTHFDEPLATAIRQNVRATKDLLDLCRTFSRLKAIVHMSSIYANFPSPIIQERFHITHVDCDRVIEMLDDLIDPVVNSTTKSLLRGLPNTYVFTKALAEQVIQRYGNGLPIAISRPATVICSDTEPSSGWVDKFSGPAGITAGVASGEIRTFNLDGSFFANVVPCDMAVNSVIVAAWEVAEKRSISQGVPIYNFTAPSTNRLTLQQYFTKNTQAIRQAPVSNAHWYPFCLVIKNIQVAIFVRFLLHHLTAHIMDAILDIQRKPTRVCSKYDKIHKYTDVANLVASNPWYHEEKNVPALWELTSKKDKELFPFDMRALDWDSYVQRSFRGIRKFLLKDEEDTIPAARIRHKRLFWIHCVALAVPMLLLCWIMLDNIQLA